MIPNAKEICEIQLMKLVDKVITTPVKEDDIAEFLPVVMDEFEGLSKEEIIKKFVSAEFNRFIEYYERAGDLNRKEGRRDRDSEKGNRRGNRNDENKTRFFVNLGKRDGLNPGGLLRVVCDSTGLRSNAIGRIDIMASFSFFEADNENVDRILSQVNGTEYEGHSVSIEVTKSKNVKKKRGGASTRQRSRGGQHRSKSGGGKFGGKRERRAPRRRN